MHSEFERAALLINQGRYREAQKVIGQTIEKTPEDPLPYVQLAQVLTELGKCRKAESAAREAIRLDPESDLVHYSLARVLLEANRETAAKKAIDEAIRLDPHCAQNYGLLARIQCDLSRWKRCLEAAEHGLELDPTDDSCQFYRAIALSRLSKKEASNQQFDELLGNDPEDADNHNGLGWALLPRGERVAAEKHFREALRIDASHEEAREGLSTCLRARNPLFSWPYRFGVWSDKFGLLGIIVVMIGLLALWEGISFVRLAYPEWATLLSIPLIVGMLVITLATIAFPFANVFLIFTKRGREALRPIERRIAIISLPLVLLGLLLFVNWALGGAQRIPVLPMLTLWLLMPLYQIAEAKRRRTRRILCVYSAVLILITLGPWIAIVASLLSWKSAAVLIGSLMVLTKMHYMALACILADTLREWLDGTTDASEDEYEHHI